MEYDSKSGRYIFDYPSMAVIGEPTYFNPFPVIYRPPPEAFSLILQPTVGCPWNKCVFCGTHKHQKFRLRVKEMETDISLALKYYGDRPVRIFLGDANSIIIPTKAFLNILNRCFEVFPRLERVSTYGGAKYILKKGEDELIELRRAGLKKIYMGLETGDDELLRFMRKGVTVNDMIEAADRVKRAGIELSVTVIQGLGGRGTWKRNAALTAEALNKIRPSETRLHSLVLHPNSPLWRMAEEKEFIEATKEEVLKELYELIRRIDYPTKIFTYSSGYLKPGVIDGKLPEDREYVLSVLKYVINNPEDDVYLQRVRFI